MKGKLQFAEFGEIGTVKDYEATGHFFMSKILRIHLGFPVLQQHHILN
jgi:hypothetical protein